LGNGSRLKGISREGTIGPSEKLSGKTSEKTGNGAKGRGETHTLAVDAVGSEVVTRETPTSKEGKGNGVRGGGKEREVC